METVYYYMKRENIMKKLFLRIISFILILLQLNTSVYADYSGHWAESILNEWINANMLKGGENNEIAPDKNITRAEFVTLLMRSSDYPISVHPCKFLDVAISDWYYSEVSSAASFGIVNGSSEKDFMPDSAITREDAVVMIARTYKIKGSAVFNISEYHDGMDISDYALEYMSFMCENELLNGYSDKTIRPKKGITRAEAVVFIARVKDYISDPTRNIEMKFANGYPRLRTSGLSNGFNITIKTTKPCKIYYTTTDPSKTIAVTDKSLIDKFLISVSDANTEVSAYIPKSDDSQCSIFFKAVDEQGNESKIASINNAKKMYYSEGNGTKNNPYIISTEQQLDAVRFFPDKHFKLKNDIILSSEWIPIGNGNEQVNMFSGSFDGAGYKISNLTVNGGDYSGLFGYINCGEVKNLYVSANKVVGKNSVGIIAGGNNGGKIENCTADGLLLARDNYGGGIVGWNNGIVNRCQSAVLAVEAQSYAGGITGWNSGTVSECMACNYSVVANMYASGIGGVNIGGTVKNCVAANMNVVDHMTDNNGKITTNRSDGIVSNNYSYNRMYATTISSVSGKDSLNGLDVSFDMLLDKDFYKENLGWDFDKHWISANENDKFRLPTLRFKAKPEMEDGITIYAPTRISTAQELELLHKEPQNHYILTNDIYLPPTDDDTSNWTPVCGDDEFTEYPENGFSGSFDGRGFSVYNMTIDYDENRKFYGMFGVIAGGSVSNLNLKNVKISSSESCGTIAAVNYGFIQNCNVDGTIIADQTKSIAMTGGIAGDNYSTIKGCEVDMQITAKGNSSTTGGICANNEGTVIDCLSKGSISGFGKSIASNSSLGGICGFSTDGKIHESCSQMKITTNSHISYVGGICGMISGGEIYKTANTASISAQAKKSINSTVYIGGIAGLSNGAIIMNSFSTKEISSDGVNVYIGGISGYNASGHIQNCYSISPITQYGEKSYAGGIAGFNESGNITDNVSVNASVRDCGTVGRIVAHNADGYVFNNYASDEIICGKRIFKNDELNGIGVSVNTLKDKNFYFKPISEGGKLGWIVGSVWNKNNGVNPYYVFPILSGVRGTINKAD